MNVLELSEDAQLMLMIVWGIVFVGLLLNLLSCWLCCCCRSFDRLRRVLASVTAFTLIVALGTTAVYTQDLARLWPTTATHRALFNHTHTERVIKTLKWLHRP